MSKKSKIEPSAKKKEENTIKAKAKFNGLKVWPSNTVLKMCQVSYPQLKLEKVIGFIETDKGKEIYLIEGSIGNLEISDAG